MRALSERQLQEAAAALLTQVRAAAPEWTDFNDSDPGITLLQLFAFVTESLLSRQSQIPPRGAEAARRLARAASALTVADSPEADCGVQRVNYFAGQLLNAKDFADEQDYFRARLRRGNRLLHGSGVVSGLGVSVAPGGGAPSQSVLVEPGFALDPRGEEIEVCQRTAAPLPPGGKQLFAQLLFAERPTSPVPVPTSTGVATSGDQQQFSRVEEKFAVVLAPAVQAGAVPIARLTFSRGRWRLDRRFQPPEVRR